MSFSKLILRSAAVSAVLALVISISTVTPSQAQSLTPEKPAVSQPWYDGAHGCHCGGRWR